MKDYGKGKIYKIVCNKTNLIYIGSTCEPTLARRLAKHVGSYKSYLKTLERKKYMTSYKIIEIGDYDIVLIEEYSCETKDQLHKRERFYIETVQCVNKNIPTRTKKEYIDLHKDEQKEYQSLYRKEHVDKLKEYNKVYREINKEQKKENDKEYYEMKKDNILIHRKQYYENNKEKINEKFTCSCGGKYVHCTKNRHLKSIMHQKYLESIDKL